jgi:hypothetical protein
MTVVTTTIYPKTNAGQAGQEGAAKRTYPSFTPRDLHVASFRMA